MSEASKIAISPDVGLAPNPVSELVGKLSVAPGDFATLNHAEAELCRRALANSMRVLMPRDKP